MRSERGGRLAGAQASRSVRSAHVPGRWSVTAPPWSRRPHAREGHCVYRLPFQVRGPFVPNDQCSSSGQGPFQGFTLARLVSGE